MPWKSTRALISEYEAQIALINKRIRERKKDPLFMMSKNYENLVLQRKSLQQSITEMQKYLDNDADIKPVRN
jgi:hypothetical protein